MATEFICSVSSSGNRSNGTFTDPDDWANEIQVNPYSLGVGDLDHAQWRVYSISGTVGNFLGEYSDGVAVSGDMYDATVIWCTSTQLYVVHDSASETFANNEHIEIDGSNYAIIASDGGGGDTAIPVLEFSGEVSSANAITFDNIQATTTNRVKLRSAGAAKRSASSELRYGSGVGRFVYTGTGNGIMINNSTRTLYLDIEDLDTNRTDTSAAFYSLRAFACGTGEVNIRRSVIKTAANSSGACVCVDDADIPIVIDNSVLYSTARYCVTVNTGSVTARYSTVCNRHATSGGAFTMTDTAGNSLTCINCYASRVGATYGTYLSANPSNATLSLTTCASSDARGTAGLQDIADSASGGAYFENVGSGTEDFRIQDTSALIDEGTTIGALVIDIFGNSRPTSSEDLGAVEFESAAVTATGAITLGSVALAGASLMAPTALYCDNTTAQSGRTNPTDITDLTPVFSAVVSTLGADITEAQIQVSAPGDADFSETPSWDSGWLDVTNKSAGQRLDDITYGQT